MEEKKSEKVSIELNVDDIETSKKKENETIE